MGRDLNRCETLLEKTRGGAASEDEIFGLLTCFHNHFDVSNLRELLQSTNPKVTKAGAWVLSELGRLGRPLLDECDRLLSHESKFVRFYALDSILANASSTEGQLVSKACLALIDSEKAVQWKCLILLQGLEVSILRAAETRCNVEWLKEGLQWLLSQLEMPEPTAIGARAASRHFMERAFAAVAASRSGLQYSSELELLSNTHDDAVAAFAKDMLEERKLKQGQHYKH